ncbi:hypothetical protein [Pseudoalteromonas luteoviolacea]|uniref:hypothetical protein n=1 Tax=Pseudoalteromonas luteoviolacea TaxID=43657 RepID=UPI00163BC0DD|nr:hypothetical protein [Pseudoalteromonas luteoviolacea]
MAMYAHHRNGFGTRLNLSQLTYAQETELGIFRLANMVARSNRLDDHERFQLESFVF